MTTVTMGLRGQPNVTIVMTNDVNDEMTINKDIGDSQPKNVKRFRERRHFHIARDRLDNELEDGKTGVFPLSIT